MNRVILLLILCATIIAAVSTFVLPQIQTAFALPNGGKIFYDCTYGQADGVKLKMDVFIPPNPDGELLPVILSIHGGAWRAGDKRSEIHSKLLPLLLRNNYIVAAINYRLAPEYKFPAQIEDAKCAVRFLRAHAEYFNIDANRIGVYGGSAGGHLAALLGLTDSQAGFDGDGGWINESSKVEAVVDFSGPTDLMNWKIRTDKKRLQTAEDVFGATDDNDPILRFASPINYVSSNVPPFLIIHGNLDSVVPVSQSIELQKALEAVSAESTLMILTNCGHGGTPARRSPQSDQNRTANGVLNFFDRILKSP